MFAESRFCVSPWLPVPALGWTLDQYIFCQPSRPRVLREPNLSDGSQGPVNPVGVVVKKKWSVLRTDGRQLKVGSLLSPGKMAAFFAMLTCQIIRNSAVPEIYSLNIINKTALTAGLQTSCWGTRKK